MANICDTQYKVCGEPEAVRDLWNTLRKLGVNGNDISLYLLAEHYGIDYEKKGISVRGYIYWADFEENKDTDYCLLSFDTESAWSACDMLFDEINKALGGGLWHTNVPEFPVLGGVYRLQHGHRTGGELQLRCAEPPGTHQPAP